MNHGAASVRILWTSNVPSPPANYALVSSAPSLLELITMSGLSSALNQIRRRQNFCFCFLLCVCFHFLPIAFAFRPRSGTSAQHSPHHPDIIQRKVKNLQQQAPLQARRRKYPIFLASAGDEGVASSDLPMAVSLIGATQTCDIL